MPPPRVPQPRAAAAAALADEDAAADAADVVVAVWPNGAANAAGLFCCPKRLIDWFWAAGWPNADVVPPKAGAAEVVAPNAGAVEPAEAAAFGPEPPRYKKNPTSKKINPACKVQTKPVSMTSLIWFRRSNLKLNSSMNYISATKSVYSLFILYVNIIRLKMNDAFT